MNAYNKKVERYFKYNLENIHYESVDSLLSYSNGIKKKYSNSPIPPGVIWRINTKSEGILCVSSFTFASIDRLNSFSFLITEFTLSLETIKCLDICVDICMDILAII